MHNISIYVYYHKDDNVEWTHFDAIAQKYEYNIICNI